MKPKDRTDERIPMFVESPRGMIGLEQMPTQAA